MSYESPGAGASVEMSCRYGMSKLPVRGPLRDLRAPYLAFVGGAETFGRFVADPFPALVEAATGRVCVNLGCANAGLDAFVHDVEILRIAQGAERIVIQIPPAQNLSNRFYRVHPRRNDRFLSESPMLAAIFREVDFTEFSFNRHMLSALQAVSADRFSTVQAELRQAWQARMRLLVQTIGGRIILLWLRYGADPEDPLGPEPLYVDREMINALRGDVEDVLEVPAQAAGRTGDLDEMVFGPLQGPVARHLIGPATHGDVAKKLVPVLRLS